MKSDQERIKEIIRILSREYPDPYKGMLNYTTPFELLIATILAAQCTDVKVNQVTKTLFKKYPNPEKLASANLAELQEEIRPTGFFRQKSKAITATSQDIVSKFGGETPRTMEELTSLRGVGRKTANVVLGRAYGQPAIIVDTHMLRIAGRLGLTDPRNSAKKDADAVEQDLMKVVPREDWTLFSHLIVQLGRTICSARDPKHDICPILELCPTGLTADSRR